MTIRHIHMHQFEILYLCYGVKCQTGVIWGHRGQKDIFTKNISTQTDYVTLTHDLCMHYLDPLYKSYHIKNSSGVIWDHKGQKVIFTKNVSTQTDYVALTHDLCICISLTPSTKVITLKIHPGSFGVTGVKRSFSPKMFQLKQIM